MDEGYLIQVFDYLVIESSEIWFAGTHLLNFAEHSDTGTIMNKVDFTLHPAFGKYRITNNQ
jgi:hypothetical protein